MPSGGNLISGLLQLIASQNAPGTTTASVRNWWQGGGSGGDDPIPPDVINPWDDPNIEGDEGEFPAYTDDDIDAAIEDIVDDIEEEEIYTEVQDPTDPDIDDPQLPLEYYSYDGYDEANQLQAAKDHQDDMLLSLYQQFVNDGDANYVVQHERLLGEDGHMLTDQNMTDEEVQNILASYGHENATGDYYFSHSYGSWMQKVEDRSRVTGMSDEAHGVMRDYKKAQFLHNWEAGMVGEYNMFVGGHTADLTQMDWSAYDSGEYGYGTLGMYEFFTSGEHGMGYNAAGEEYDGWNWTDYYNFQYHGTQTNYSGNAGSGYWNDPNSSYGTYYAFEDGMTGYMQSWDNRTEGAGFNNDPNTPGGFGISWYDSDGNYRGEASGDNAPVAWSRDSEWVYNPFQFEYNGVTHG